MTDMQVSTVADGVYGSFFPAIVTFPGEPADGYPAGEVWHLARVYLGTRGIEVYRQRPKAGLDDHPDFRAPIDFAATARPNWSARNVGVDVVTELGTVVLTPSGGCGCGSTLKRWAGPEYAHNVIAWPGN